MKIDNEQLYSRQLKLIGSIGQDLISNARVLVIGVGGLGCPVLQYLTTAGVGTIGIVDHDRIEVSNLQRQILFHINDVGLNKAHVASKECKKLNHLIEIESFPIKCDETNADELISNYDIIVDCTDNLRSKFLIHDTCFKLKKKCIQASVYQYEGQLHVFDFTSPDCLSQKPCLRCLWDKNPEVTIAASCNGVGVLGPLLGVLGSMQAMEVLKMILNKTLLSNGEGLFVDLMTLDFEKRCWTKNSHCPLCSNHEKQKIEKRSFEIEDIINQDHFTLIDVRSFEDSKNSLLTYKNVINRPQSQFSVVDLDPSKKYVLVCENGITAYKLAKACQEMGYENIFTLKDGLRSLSTK